MEIKIESDIIEFKEVTKNSLPKNLWKVISAFANADGGSIYLGKNSLGETTGVTKLAQDKIIGDINTLCRSTFNHKIYPEIKVSKDNVIHIFIPPTPSTMRPIFSESRGLPKGARVRVGTSNVKVDDEWIRRFGRASQGGAELIEFPVKHKQYFSTNTLEKYLLVINQKRGDIYKNLNKETILQKLRAITSNKNITMFGLLAFSNEYGLQELTAPTVNIAVTQYSGIEKVNLLDVTEISLDDKEFNGNISSQFENALKFIMSKLPIRSHVKPGGKRQSYLAIPELAIRETLANSLAHRDYGTYKSRIQVDIYSDRIEFTNPGKSLIPLSNIEEAHPQTRNPLLMSYLRDLHITEHRGRGIKTIINSLKEAGLTAPVFEHRYDWFVATLYSSSFIKDKDQDWLKKFQKLGLNERQLKTLVHLKHNDTGITNSEYRGLNSMTNVGDDRKAKRELVKMVNLNILSKTGANRNRKYILLN